MKEAGKVEDEGGRENWETEKQDSSIEAKAEHLGWLRSVLFAWAAGAGGTYHQYLGDQVVVVHLCRRTQRRRTGRAPNTLLSRRALERLGAASSLLTSRYSFAISPQLHVAGLQLATASIMRCCRRVVPAQRRVVDALERRTRSCSNSGRVRLTTAEDSLARSAGLHPLYIATVLH
nr:hypothetical protein CFP56_09510 [Quercus suber]